MRRGTGRPPRLEPQGPGPVTVLDAAGQVRGVVVPAPRLVSDQDFYSRRAELACRECGRVGELTLHVQASNGGIRPHCPGCGCRSPIAGVLWLRQRAL